MGLKKGMTNNPRGRRPGTPNKVTTDLRQWIKELLDQNKERMMSDLDEVKPGQRLIFLEKLMNYAIPRKQDSTLSLINKMSDEDLDKVVNELIERIE